MTSDCVDPYQPKVVRASMGSIFRVPFFEVQDPIEYLQKSTASGVHIYGMFPKGGHNLLKAKTLYPALLLIGSENEGLPENLPIEIRLSIPMKGNVESINAAMAATIGFYFFVSPSVQQND
jgi:TrmH family RNA methyltransferase